MLISGNSLRKIIRKELKKGRLNEVHPLLLLFVVVGGSLYQEKESKKEEAKADPRLSGNKRYEDPVGELGEYWVYEDTSKLWDKIHGELEKREKRNIQDLKSEFKSKQNALTILGLGLTREGKDKLDKENKKDNYIVIKKEQLKLPKPIDSEYLPKEFDSRFVQKGLFKAFKYLQRGQDPVGFWDDFVDSFEEIELEKLGDGTYYYDPKTDSQKIYKSKDFSIEDPDRRYVYSDSQYQYFDRDDYILIVRPPNKEVGIDEEHILLKGKISSGLYNLVFAMYGKSKYISGEPFNFALGSSGKIYIRPIGDNKYFSIDLERLQIEADKSSDDPLLYRMLYYGDYIREIYVIHELINNQKAKLRKNTAFDKWWRKKYSKHHANYELFLTFQYKKSIDKIKKKKAELGRKIIDKRNSRPPTINRMIRFLQKSYINNHHADIYIRKHDMTAGSFDNPIYIFDNFSLDNKRRFPRKKSFTDLVDKLYDKQNGIEPLLNKFNEKEENKEQYEALGGSEYIPNQFYAYLGMENIDGEDQEVIIIELANQSDDDLSPIKEK